MHVWVKHTYKYQHLAENSTAQVGEADARRLKELEAAVAAATKELQKLERSASGPKDRAAALQQKIEAAGGQPLKQARKRVAELQQVKSQSGCSHSVFGKNDCVPMPVVPSSLVPPSIRTDCLLPVSNHILHILKFAYLLLYLMSLSAVAIVVAQLP